MVYLIEFVHLRYPVSYDVGNILLTRFRPVEPIAVFHIFGLIRSTFLLEVRVRLREGGRRSRRGVIAGGGTRCHRYRYADYTFHHELLGSLQGYPSVKDDEPWNDEETVPEESNPQNQT
jgi:hypothetical protein